MPLAHISSAAFFGIDALPIDIEVDGKISEKPLLLIVGLPDTAVKESKDRVLSALRNATLSCEAFTGTINLAPGALKKEGALYDLPIALALLQATRNASTAISDFLCIGELALSSQTRPMQGALAAALLAKQLGKKGIVLPLQNAQEAAMVEGIDVIGVQNLREAWEFFCNTSRISPTLIDRKNLFETSSKHDVDMADIKGQLAVKRALEIAAAGHHNILLSGPPGTGKTMLAKALRTILPPLAIDEAIEVTRIHSVAGLLNTSTQLVTERPFRSPHHSISAVALIGGSSHPRPGELTLAHEGVLFLDELPEFSRPTLEALRQPLEDRVVTISRALGTVTFPTNCLFIAAMNPCPCGHLGHPTKPCKDSALQISRYRSKISGPLLERIDLHIEVPVIPMEDMHSNTSTESSSIIQQRVAEARKRQEMRLGSGRANSSLKAPELKIHAKLNKDTETLARQAMKSFSLSMRSYHRLLKVARTIADLSDSSDILEEHFLEALTYRPVEK